MNAKYRIVSIMITTMWRKTCIKIKDWSKCTQLLVASVLSGSILLPFVYLPKIVQLDYVIFSWKKKVCIKTNIISSPLLMRLPIQDWYSEVSLCVGKPVLDAPSPWCPLSHTAPRMHRTPPSVGISLNPTQHPNCTSSPLLLISFFMHAFKRKDSFINCPLCARH